MCGAGTMGSIVFINAEDISSIGACMDGAIEFEVSTMSVKTGDDSCIN